MQDGKIRACCCPGIVVKFRRTHQALLRVQQVYEVTKERQDTGAIPSTPRTKIQMKDNQGGAGNRLRDLPEWLEEFTDNLEAVEQQTFLMTQIRNVL